MSRTKLSIAMALVASAALSVSLTGCFGDEETANPVTTGDNTAISLKSTQEAGAQKASLGSFISVRGDALDAGGFVLTSGEKTAEEEAALDLVFFAMNGTTKDDAGTPTFVSPNLIKSTLNWSTTNKTIIVPATGKTEADFKTVQNVKDVIGSSTSESAPVTNGATYALLLSNGKYAIVSVTALVGATSEATVSFKIIK